MANTVPIYNPSQAQVIDNPIKLFLGATDFAAFGTATLTREAKGKYYWSIPASGTVELVASLKLGLRNLQSSVVSYAKAGQVNGAFTLKSVTANYLISGAALTSAALTLSATTFPANNTVTTPTVVDLLLAAQGGLSLATQADLYQTVLTPANGNLMPLNTDYLSCELVAVNPASAVMHFYGIDINLNYGS